MTTQAPSIEIHHLTVRYGTTSAVHDLTLTIPAGILYCLLGRNGAGKTTTLQVLLGLTRPTSGRVRLSAQGYSIGYLPEASILYEHLTGREFIEFIAALHGAAAPKCIDRGLELVGMAGEADYLIRTYSLGMKRRIAFLAAILHEPELLLLDEPTGSLDAVGSRMVKDTMEAFRDAGRTVVFTTHILELAERIADRFGILHEGVLRFEGTLAELRRTHGRNTEEPLESIFLRITQGNPDNVPIGPDQSMGAA